MKKSDKKVEKALIEALTEVCESALEEVAGFKWLTHTVNYKNFPESLTIICVFDTKKNLNDLYSAKKEDYFHHHVQEKLDTIAVNLHDVQRQVRFDTEEACEIDNAGNWQKRLSERRP